MSAPESLLGEAFSLEGKKAAVTGASGDIGKGIALALADAGAEVALLSRRLEILEALAEEIRRRGQRAIATRVDVTDPEEVETAVEMVNKELGAVDVLVNNAGGARFLASALEISARGWEKTVALNLTAPFLITQAFGHAMVKQGGGSVVNVGSVAGLRHLTGMSAYSSAKGGLFAQTRALAREWAPYGVRVNAVAPGYVDTSGWQAFDTEKIVSDSDLSIPLGRWASVKEVALPVVFLASDAASYITGTTLLIDGGMLA